MKSSTTRRAAPSQGGFTLLEALVAVLLLSIGLLGLASLQAWGLRATGSATYRSQATLLANEMVERIRANQVGAANYNFTTTGCNVVNRCFGADECSPTELATADYYAVSCGNGANDGAGIDDVLPSGSMTVACTGQGANCSVTVSWQELADNNPADTQGAARESALRLVFIP